MSRAGVAALASVGILLTVSGESGAEWSGGAVTRDVNSVDTVRVAMRALEVAGLDPVVELEKAGASIVNGAVRVGLSREAYCALWARMARVSRREDFGLVLARELEPGMLGPLEWLATSARNVGEGLQALAESGRLLHTGGFYAVHRRGPEAAFVYASGRSRVVVRPLLDWSFAYLVRTMRRVTVGGVKLREVHLQYARPADAARVEEAFAAPVVFDAPLNEIVLDREQLDLPLLTSDPEAHTLLAALCRQRCAALAADDLELRVRALLLRQLATEQLPTLETVARQLGMSARSLQRGLTEEGLSFRQLLLEARMETAERWLADPARSVGQIAYALGYSEPSAFHRAYRGYFGRACRRDAAAV